MGISLSRSERSFIFTFVVPEIIRTLKSGGVHIMMMGLVKPFSDGDLIKIKLFFENAGEVIVNLVVGNGD